MQKERQKGEISRAVVAHSLTSALGRQKQADLCGFKASLVYRVSYGTARTTQRNPALKNQKKKKKKERKGKWRS